MEQFDRENSSNYMQQTNRTADSPAAQGDAPAPTPVQPVEPPKPRRSKAPLVLTLLLLLALLGLAAFGWLWYQQNGRVDNLEADLSSARNKVTQLESKAKAEASLNDAKSDTTIEGTDSDSDLILRATLTYLKAKTLTDESKLEVAIAKKNLKFASVTSTTKGSSGAITLYLKKVDTDWIVIGDSMDDPDMLKSEYGIGEDIL